MTEPTWQCSVRQSQAAVIDTIRTWTTFTEQLTPCEVPVTPGDNLVKHRYGWISGLERTGACGSGVVGIATGVSEPNGEST
jgi:hypothetical protein